jgi:hypothetical protein
MMAVSPVQETWAISASRISTQGGSECSGWYQSSPEANIVAYLTMAVFEEHELKGLVSGRMFERRKYVLARDLLALHGRGHKVPGVKATLVVIPKGATVDLDGPPDAGGFVPITCHGASYRVFGCDLEDPSIAVTPED